MPIMFSFLLLQKSSASLAENAKSKTKAVMHETPEEEEESRGDVSESRDESSGSEDEQKMEAGGGVDDKLVEKRKEEKEKEEEEDDDDDWDNYRMESKKENSLETRKKESHPVHCPFFPAVSTFLLGNMLAISVFLDLLLQSSENCCNRR